MQGGGLDPGGLSVGTKSGKLRRGQWLEVRVDRLDTNESKLGSINHAL